MKLTAPLRVLMATMKPLFRDPPWLFTVESGRSAISWWESCRPGTVLADFGGLSDGMSGVRVAKTIRSQCAGTRIYLLSDAVRPEQQQWARSQGADDVIPRRHEVIERLFNPDADLRERRRRLVQRVARRLNDVGGVGPAARLMVEEALGEWEQRCHGEMPSAYQLTLAVSRHVADPVLRSAFIDGFAETAEEVRDTRPGPLDSRLDGPASRWGDGMKSAPMPLPEADAPVARPRLPGGTAGAGAGGQWGFTVIELMIVLAVAAILSTIVLPSYSLYAARARVLPGLTKLDLYGAHMDQHFLDLSSYAGAGGCGVPVPPDDEHFSYRCRLAGRGYLATATGQGLLAGYQYSIDQAGMRMTLSHPNGAPAVRCWSIRGGTCDT